MNKILLLKFLPQILHGQPVGLPGVVAPLPSITGEGIKQFVVGAFGVEGQQVGGWHIVTTAGALGAVEVVVGRVGHVGAGVEQAQVVQ